MEEVQSKYSKRDHSSIEYVCDNGKFKNLYPYMEELTEVDLSMYNAPSPSIGEFNCTIHGSARINEEATLVTQLRPRTE